MDLQHCINALSRPDWAQQGHAFYERALQRQLRLTKPAGSLGLLEQLSARVAAIQHSDAPSCDQPSIVVCMADHGIAASGVSAYPAAVTAQMAANYASGGAAINVLARHCGARLTLVDMGIGPALEPAPGIIDRKVANGTRNFALEPAMSELQARRALQTGIELALRESKLGANLICTGEMGIGNTTSSSAIVACCTGESPAHVTGSGTGIDAATLQKKIDMVDLSLQRHAPNPADGIDMLAKIGGFEIGALAGLILGAACLRIPVLLDGFITTAAALVAAALAPQVVHGLIASHVSLEPGHAIALRKLALVPVLSLGMRLGEGSGAAIAIPVVQAACKLLNEMATFDEAGVSKAVQ